MRVGRGWEEGGEGSEEQSPPQNFVPLNNVLSRVIHAFGTLKDRKIGRPEGAGPVEETGSKAI